MLRGMTDEIQHALVSSSVYLVQKRPRKHPPFIYRLIMKKGVTTCYLIQNHKTRFPFPILLGVVYDFRTHSLKMACSHITPWNIIYVFPLGNFYALPEPRYHKVVQSTYYIQNFENLYF